MRPIMYMYRCSKGLGPRLYTMKRLICLKLVIWVLNWPMEMFGAGTSFFKFSISGLVTLDRSKCVQTLKLDVLDTVKWRFADFNATWKPLNTT